MFFIHNIATISLRSKNNYFPENSMKNKPYQSKKIKFALNCDPEKKNEIGYNENKPIENEDNALSFIKEISTEMKMIEWPSLDRLFKQFVIVVISLVFSAVFIYAIDGIFASLSKFLFEGN
jgi:preprotein translocase SecE subunit